ncbi:hypothetical protein BC826DRAFT_1039546, partial [Russula brevipes]
QWTYCTYVLSHTVLICNSASLRPLPSNHHRQPDFIRFGTALSCVLCAVHATSSANCKYGSMLYHLKPPFPIPQLFESQVSLETSYTL